MNVLNLINKEKSLSSDIVNSWKGSVLHEETSLHQVSPYIGKMKSSMAGALISSFSQKGDTIYDPYCGSGTVALEAWIAGRHIIANDLSPYAFTLTQAKLYPYYSIEDAVNKINEIAEEVKTICSKVDLRKVPQWVRAFFHPETLREVIAWVQVLTSNKSFFLLSCLLGILHHQRPGFLSYPSSHTVPYLREKKFPRDKYPDMYLYRSVKERLERKVIRALKRVPDFDDGLIRNCYMLKTNELIPKQRVNNIITSPPYMRQLDYGRDNRLRLWFLGVKDWKSLDNDVSPSEFKFLSLFKDCLKLWHKVLLPNGLCVLVLGDINSRTYNLSLPDAVAKIATKEIGGYSVISKHKDIIPNDRRVRRGCYGTLKETILVLRKNKNT